MLELSGAYASFHAGNRQLYGLSSAESKNVFCSSSASVVLTVVMLVILALEVDDRMASAVDEALCLAMGKGSKRK